MDELEKIQYGINLFSGCSVERYGRLLNASYKYPEFFDCLADETAMANLINIALDNGDIIPDDIVFLQDKGVV